MIPKNSIAIKSTSGGEYVELKTNTPYKGYYYEYKDKIYAGAEFVVSGSIELVGVNDTNKLLNNSSTSIYSFASGLTSQTLQTPTINSIIFNEDGSHGDPYVVPRFYYKKHNDNIIKEIDESTYLNLKTNPIYLITYTGPYDGTNQTIDEADEQLPGLKLFTSGYVDDVST
jgi:hypothetical protein